MQNHTVQPPFSSELTESGKRLVESTIRDISKYSNKFLHSSRYSPYLAICQSNGLGKSRTTLECGKRLISVYALFKNGDANQAQWMSEFVDFVNGAEEDDIKTNINSSLLNSKVGRVLIFLEIVFENLKDWFLRLANNQDTKYIWNDSQPETTLTNEEIKKLSKVYDEINDAFKFNGPEISSFSNNIHVRLNDRISDGYYRDYSIEKATSTITEISIIFSGINKMVSRFKDKVEREKRKRSKNVWTLDAEKDAFPVLFILDELGTMSYPTYSNNSIRISFMTAVRQALHFLPKTNSLLFIALGSDCTIFKPDENFLRFNNRRELQIPYVFTGNWNIVSTEIDFQKLVIDANLLRNNRTILLLVSFGRALWSSVAINDVFDLALQKLRNGSEDTNFSFIASWSIRTGLYINSNSFMAEKLLSSHMATLFSVSHIGGIRVEYPSEPVLAISARELVSRNESAKMFQVLFNSIENSYIDRGNVTEFVFSEIFLRAIDKGEKIQMISDKNPKGANDRIKKIYSAKSFLLKPESNSTDEKYDIFSSRYHVTTVSSFILKLYDSKIVINCIPDKLKNGLINACQFIELHRDYSFERINLEKALPDASGNLKMHCDIIDKALLQTGLLRQCAYKMPESYYGIDAIIPVAVEVEVKIKNPLDDSLESAKLMKEKKTFFTYIAIQCKSGAARTIDTIVKMNPLLHARKDSFDKDEWEFLVNNHLVIVASAKNDAKPNLNANNSRTMNASVYYKNNFTMQHVFSSLFPKFKILKSNSENEVNQKQILVLESFQNADDLESENDADKIELKRISPNEKENASSMFSSYGIIKLNPDRAVSIYRFKKKKCTLSCIWSNTLNTFNVLLGSEAVDSAKKVIYFERDTFLNYSYIPKPYSDFILKILRD